MPQWHLHQHGTFHVTTNTKDKEPWCIVPGIPQIIIGNLLLTRHLQQAKVHAFCILPDHMHIIFEPGKRGLSAFVKSFKENSSRQIRRYRNGDLNASLVSADAVVCADMSGLPTPASTFHGWQHGFHAQRIVQPGHYEQTIQYVERNASHHGLVRTAKEWPWTSLHFGHLMDSGACPLRAVRNIFSSLSQKVVTIR
ncbi:MAG: hypothetical protein HOO67_05860 [Candidatus Peribacteraceae bacterium]|nr:hypothetical protein [Candidatus Peribacteraceae bacterium]